MSSIFGNKLQVFHCSSNHELAKRVADNLKIPLSKSSVTAFPDGETFVKIEENIRGDDIFIIQPTCPPTNQHIMELLIMIDAMRRASAFRITAVIPFFGYARQDRKDQPRVPITAKLVANLLVAAGANRILTIDLHAQQIQGFFDIPVDHLYAAPVFHNHIKEKNIENMIVVSPDVGGMKMASAYSQMFGTGLAIVAKRRKSATEIESLYVVGDVKDKNVLLVDDITETAGTICSAAKLLKQHGAKDIYAAISHSILSPIAEQRLKNSEIKELITTNTTPVPSIPGFNVTVLCVAELLAESIRRIHSGESVSSLFYVHKD
jgi:ribose-phosphate pyrophosphokinase